jgi:DNA-binding HxlR family transcriptional regulator
MNDQVSPASPSLPVLPTQATDVGLFLDHYRDLVEFTDRLREGRCRKTRRFGPDLAVTMQAFEPLFAAWTTQILFTIYMHGPQRFNALKGTLDGVSSRVLTDKLRHLARHGFLRHDAAARTYALSSQGDLVARHLHPILFALHNAVP